MAWIYTHPEFVIGMFCGWLIWGILIRSMEKLAEITLGGAYIRTRRIEELEAERDRWRGRYNAILESVSAEGGK